jgi:hypothetical protein
MSRPRIPMSQSSSRLDLPRLRAAMKCPVFRANLCGGVCVYLSDEILPVGFFANATIRVWLRKMVKVGSGLCAS